MKLGLLLLSVILYGAICRKLPIKNRMKSLRSKKTKNIINNSKLSKDKIKNSK